MERPLSLVLVTIEYPPDPFSAGIGSYTSTLARRLTERGHRVQVVTRGTSGDEVAVEAGVVVHRLTPPRPELPTEIGLAGTVRLAARGLAGELRYRRKIVGRLDALVAGGRVDLIESADHLGEPSGYRPERHPAVPFVVRLHAPLGFSETLDKNISEPLRRLVSAIERRLLARATHLSAPSSFAADAFREEMRLGDRPVAIYPNPPTFNLQPPPEAAAEDPATVLFVGRISRWKGVHLLVAALPEVAAANPEVRFVLAGADNLAYGGFATVGAYLRSLVPERYHHHLEFTGHLPHEALRDHLRRATLCVFPSLFDAFAYTCLEAMSYGKAIVGSANSGMAELLDDGAAGLLYRPPDIASLAAAINRLLADPGLRADLGARARARFATHYRPEEAIERALAFYRRALADAAAR